MAATFSVAPKAKREERSYQVTRTASCAQAFLYGKVAINGVVFEGKGAFAKYEKAIDALSAADRKAACDYATKLNAESHARRVAKQTPAVATQGRW